MFDVIVIGGGPGGYAAAICASQMGAKVAIVEAEQMGGTCVNSGCIPTKVWHHTATLYYRILGAQEFGIKVPALELDLKTIAERVSSVSNYIRMGMEGLLKDRQIKLFKDHAVLKSPSEALVGDAVLEAKKIIIATGSSPVTSSVPGIGAALWATDEMLKMSVIPDSVMVWGSPGANGVEIASLLNSLGSKVVLAFPGRRVLPGEDWETRQRIEQALREQGIKIISRSQLESVEKTDGGYECLLTGPVDKTVVVDKILTTARRPRTVDLGLEQIGVELDNNSAIWVNDALETTVPGIYAVGDVTGGRMLSHAATAMGLVAAANAMGDAQEFPFHLIPRGLWTRPEMGSVGLSEEEAEAKGIEIEVGDFPYGINGMAMVQSKMQGAVKIISKQDDGGILGVHIVGARATDLIGEAVMAMQLEACAEDLANSMRLHPTFSEILPEAARDVENWALYLPTR